MKREFLALQPPIRKSSLLQDVNGFATMNREIIA
jgi:hypothetical protein